jgi:hypothetical protein
MKRNKLRLVAEGAESKEELENYLKRIAGLNDKEFQITGKRKGGLISMIIKDKRKATELLQQNCLNGNSAPISFYVEN